MQKRPAWIKPRANEIVITANIVVVNEDNKKVIDKDQQQMWVDPYQKVLAVGSVVRDIKVGDIIAVKPDRFAKYQEQKSRVKAAVDGYEKVLVGYDFPIIELANANVMLISDADVKFVVDGGFCEDDNTCMEVDNEGKCPCGADEC